MVVGEGEPGFGPAAEPLLFRQKWPKPLTPRLASWEGRDANIVKSGPTRRAHTGSAKCSERPSLGLAGRRRVNGPSGDLMGSPVDRLEGDGEDVRIDGCRMINDGGAVRVW